MVSNVRKRVAPLHLFMTIPLVILFPFSVAIAQSNTPSSVSSAVSQSQPSPEMLIAGGDLLEVSVYGTDFDKQVRVNDAGKISLPLVGEVKVSGLSIDEAERELAKKLSQGGYFVDPQVSIFEREYATQAISVLGQVQKPGLYPLPGTRTLFDAIAAAGGTTLTAGNEVTLTHRGQTDKPEIVSMSYKAGDQKADVPVYPGDTIVVSKAGIVYVVGDVREPKGIVMENSKMTVLEAISMAAGLNPTASVGHARVIRNTPAGPQEVRLQLKKILAAKSPDIPLEAGDILFVPTSTAKSAGRRSLEAIVQAATGAAIYRPY